MPISAKEFKNNEDISNGVHLDCNEVVIFRILEENKDKAFTYKEIVDDILCIWYQPKLREKIAQKLEKMVLEGKIKGKYIKEKKNYYYCLL